MSTELNSVNKVLLSSDYAWDEWCSSGYVTFDFYPFMDKSLRKLDKKALWVTC